MHPGDRQRDHFVIEQQTFNHVCVAEVAFDRASPAELPFQAAAFCALEARIVVVVEVVENDEPLLGRRQQVLDEVAADEAGAAGDEQTT